MADEYEKLPGGWYTNFGEIRKFRNREDFRVVDPDDKVHIIECNHEVMNAFYYYSEIWDNCHHYGLPSGGDWTLNPPWLVSFVKKFDRIYQQIENYRIEKRRK